MPVSIIELETTLSPFEIFCIFKDEPYSFLLESASKNLKLGWLDGETGNYSIVGFEPFMVIKSKNRNIIIENNNRINTSSENIFKLLSELINQYNIKENTKLPAPGVVGYFGYDLKHFVEKLPSKAEDDTGFNDCVLGFYDPLIIHSSKSGKNYICCANLTSYSKKILKKIIEKTKTRNYIKKEEESIEIKSKINFENFKSNFTKDRYLKSIEIAKEYIYNGDIFQVNLSQRFHTLYDGNPLHLYLKLKKVSPAPFSAYINSGEISIISSSPERFLRLENRIVTTRPMKGTRPRGKNPEEDKILRQELIDSEKDKAELIMIVDLLRNDLGKVCDYKSIKVNSLRTVEKHPTVFQTTATITGKLNRKKTSIDLLKACFPGGSITGCPKIRSMEIIDELEPTTRSVYTGALGYISFGGNMDLSIVIRTLILKNRNVFFQVGGGIVSDSIPEIEYQETLDKAKSLMLALSKN